MLSYTTPGATVQQVLVKHQSSTPPSENLLVQKVLHRLKLCRTAALGYHLYRCSNEECGEIKYQYHPSFIGTAVTGIVHSVAPSKNKIG